MRLPIGPLTDSFLKLQSMLLQSLNALKTGDEDENGNKNVKVQAGKEVHIDGGTHILETAPTIDMNP